MYLPPTVVSQENCTMWKNHSQQERPPTNTVLNAITFLVCIFGLAGNGIVVFFLGFRIKRNKFTVYILNLALADCMFLLCAAFLILLITVFMMESGTSDNHLNMDHIRNVATSLMLVCLFGYHTSLCLLTAISVERCLSVLYPICYQCRRPKHLSAVVCSLLWILSCLVTSAEFFICDMQKYLFKDEELLIKNSEWCTIIYVSTGLLGFLVFAPLMVLSSLTLLIKVKRDSWKRQPSKLYVVIVASIVFFILFAMPIRVLVLIKYRYHSLLPMVLVDVSSLLCSINSSANPFIYWFVGRWNGGKGSFQIMLQRIFRDEMKTCRGHNSGRNGSETVV